MYAQFQPKTPRPGSNISITLLYISLSLNHS